VRVGRVTRMLRKSYEEVTRNLLPWNLAFTNRRATARFARVVPVSVSDCVCICV